MEVVAAGAQDEVMQSLDYKLKTSNTSYVMARHDVQYFPSSLSSFSPTTSRVCRIPLTSGTFIDPKSIKIAFRVRNTDGTNPLAPATPNLLRPARPVFANGQRCDDINYYGRTVAVHDLLKGREYNPNKAMEGFDEVDDPRIAGGNADVLLRPTMVGVLRCGKMLPPQLNLVIEIEFADATTALWSPGRTRLRDPERPSSGLPGRPGRVLQPRAPLRKVPGVQLPPETHGRVCDLLGQRRGLQDPLAGQRGPHQRGQAGSLLKSQMQLGSLQY